MILSVRRINITRVLPSSFLGLLLAALLLLFTWLSSLSSELVEYRPLSIVDKGLRG